MRLKHFPDKPWEQDPKRLVEWDRSGNYNCQQKIDGWRTVIILTETGIEYLSRHDKSLDRDIEPEVKADALALKDVFPAGTQIDAEWLSRRSCSKEYNLRPMLYLLDIMRHGGEWLLAKPYRERQAILKDGMAQRDRDLLAEGGDLGKNRIALPLTAESGKFAAFYEAQMSIPYSEGVVVKHLDSKIVGNRKECVKNPLIFKVKYRAGADGTQRLDHLKR